MKRGIAKAEISYPYASHPEAFALQVEAVRHDATCFDIRMEEEPDRYEISAQLPKLRKQDIHVNVEGSCVTLAMQRDTKTNGQPTFPIVGVMKNRIALNDDDLLVIHTFFLESAIDVAKAHATFQNGVLELMLPKSTASRRLLIN